MLDKLAAARDALRHGEQGAPIGSVFDLRTRSRSSNQSIRSKQNKIEEIEKKRLTDSGVIAPWVRAPTVAPRCRGRASACAVFSLGFRFFQAAID
jgi:hypothetical protein